MNSYGDGSEYIFDNNHVIRIRSELARQATSPVYSAPSLFFFMGRDGVVAVGGGNTSRSTTLSDGEESQTSAKPLARTRGAKMLQRVELITW